MKRHFIDLAAKPQWFLDLVNDYGAKAETPCVLLPGGEFVTDTAKVLARLPRDVLQLVMSWLWVARLTSVAVARVDPDGPVFRAQALEVEPSGRVCVCT